MFIWAAIDIDNQLFEQKEIIRTVEKTVDFKQSDVSSLPLHVSLKISSEVSKEHEKALRNDIKNLLESTYSFQIEIDKIELNGTIVWIKMKENDELRYLHSELCNIYSKYRIALHEFDKSFAFHSTLFLDSDTDKISQAFKQMKDISLPKVLLANKFIIGSSPKGKIGTYKVDTIIEKATKEKLISIAYKNA